MSDGNTPPNGTTTPPGAPAGGTAPIVPPAGSAPAGDPAWLPERLERAKATAKAEAIAETLKTLGVESLDVGKARIAKATALEESQKTEIQRLTDKATTLEAEAKRAKDLDVVVAKHADAEMAKLTEEQKAAVTALAGDDKARTLATIEAIRPTWAKPATTTTPIVPAAQTGATGAPPAGNGPPPTVNHKATWESLKTSNPIYAAQYLEAHQAEIFPQP